MELVVGFPRRQHDSIWVIVERMKELSHFISIKSSYSVEEYAKLYINYIVKLYRVYLYIIFDRASQLTLHFLKAFQKVFRTNVNLSTVFHPQTDGQAENTIQTLEDTLRSCLIDFKGSWDDHIPLI